MLVNFSTVPVEAIVQTHHVHRQAHGRTTSTSRASCGSAAGPISGVSRTSASPVAS